jgi:alpha-galactosidase
LNLAPDRGSWNDFRCNGITAEHVMEVADKMVALGLKAAGYQYVNIDDVSFVFCST